MANLKWQYYSKEIISMGIFFKFFHFVDNIGRVLKGQFRLNLSLQIVLTPKHAGLIDDVDRREAHKPRHDRILKIEAFPLPPKVILLEKLQPDEARSRLVVHLLESPNFPLRVFPVLILDLFVIFICLIFFICLILFHNYILYNHQPNSFCSNIWTKRFQTIWKSWYENETKKTEWCQIGI